MKNCNLLVLIFLTPLILYSQNSYSSSGTSGILFLRTPVSAYTTAMGEAFTAVADDENALFYNPSGLIKFSSSSLSLNHTEWFEDIRFDNIVFAYEFNFRLKAAISLSHMWLPAIQGKDEFGNSTHEITVSSTIIHSGFAYKIHPSFFLGIGAKFFSDNLAEVRTNGFAFDAGIYIYTLIHGLTFGASVQNIGGKVKYIDAAQNLPFTYRAGLAYMLPFSSFLLSADFVKSQDTEGYFCFGARYRYDDKFTLMVGNQFRSENTFTPSFGAGFSVTDQFHLTYAFSVPSDLGSTHRFGFKFEFNKPVRSYVTRRSPIVPEKPTQPEKSLESPRDITFLLYDNKLELRWKKQEDALYNVYGRDPDNKWVKLNSEPVKENYIVFYNPKSGKKYSFSVSAVVGEKESPLSKEVSIYVDQE
ncbi:MAG: PorV/PorQ family protein [Calditrichae bacterium]|nr:PorV/PorQ family protein [Calditrichia bacterium]